ncbi:hypothetical protein C5C45_00650 [Rathayibacter rathayi]|uniref:Uncharacterized protein n=1 Tax=Rathayibacter rathayi TaxID=33887 RepID=A0ABX5AEA4_RATRA|nr:hypothetical protein C5C34_05765 [Rathayibacter rathayi]PPF51558.1 hypothetical protein C5C08_01755 [Rathayibacter rathayi]PPF83149.1 hypothetical protein C5C14_01795 [Rathayibacter rathayi]PPG46979.1 hypothetical protein C5C20_01750 [Rathayibacter rathayi]PPG96559.1 hypothetical protein C5C22_02775 [Rathayibacter rathayi]
MAVVEQDVQPHAVDVRVLAAQVVADRLDRHERLAGRTGQERSPWLTHRLCSPSEDCECRDRRFATALLVGRVGLVTACGGLELLPGVRGRFDGRGLPGSPGCLSRLRSSCLRLRGSTGEPPSDGGADSQRISASRRATRCSYPGYKGAVVLRGGGAQRRGASGGLQDVAVIDEGA